MHVAKPASVSAANILKYANMSESMFDIELIKRYDQSGPRYTSYPTAVSFTEEFGEECYYTAAALSNEDPIPKPLSLYFHIPFCDTICFYCACNKIATKDYSRVDDYLKRLFREIEMQAELFDSDRVVNQLHWGGGTPTFLSVEQMAALMAKTREHFHLADDEDGEFSIEIDPRSVTRESILALREIGFNRFSLGVQDVDPVVQKAINRVQPESINKVITEACQESGARSINFDLIYGLPLQTEERFRATLDSVIALSPDRISVFNYAHLPHRFKPQRRINDDDLPSGTEKLAILQLTIERLTEAGYVFIGMDHFAKPTDELVIAQRTGKLHRNFQGYTTHGDCDLVAMGVSSISKVCDTYSQNAKTLDEYYAAIDAGKLPIIGGVRLDSDDLLRRELIQTLMCNFSLSMNQIEENFKVSFEQYFENELKLLVPMIKDGLLEIKDRQIVVLERGRMLVRNICMVFDARLRDMKNVQKFSRVI